MLKTKVFFVDTQTLLKTRKPKASLQAFGTVQKQKSKSYFYENAHQ